MLHKKLEEYNSAFEKIMEELEEPEMPEDPKSSAPEESNDENEADIVGVIHFAWLKQEGSTTLKLFQYFLVIYEKDTDPYVTVDVLKIMSGFDLMTKPSSKAHSAPSIYASNSLYARPAIENPVPLMVFPYSLLRKYLVTTFPQSQTDMLGEADGTFVNHANSLMLTLNVYWFKLFEGRIYTGGALYLLISNFPKEDQMRPENIILVDVMPDCYGSIAVRTTKFPNGTTVYTAIMYVASKISAARNTAGFTEHDIKINYVWHVNENWESRTEEMISIYDNMWFCTESDVERENLEKQNGMQFSKLHRLHDLFEIPLYFSAAVIARIQCFADDIPLPPEYTVLFEKTNLAKTCRKLKGPLNKYLHIDYAGQPLGVAQVLSESHLLCLQCIDNDYPPALPFDLPMFQQVINSLWYNVIGTKTLPPTTMPLKLQNLNTMKYDYS
ncbi:hypothetical protein PHYBLDRAFT_143988 [Phycomyces blakesleeanus NRRL 1555(-)]|uniref:Uncharacterized protein n=1 Tax=Phycomyces blakesleeanus (strain ATCC 8743b / DSM 1359 / FGSC 10004 / NBRC 33097 / NRRL 1555) TaxID=763407 RepID=A0A167NEX7_PHYB8|nr:hypothetical protein PHYBLDRAFT_143988 [Phycomyces blakesleeanus NRRL 1555(-)]OAD75739.1 hypothetical protein PHYBLDRAFT_143988 [Phycomyces blakesleeanus NRRL 1555(-)]|eukprot:XP_018293779.1 hypothetical protein PHYBLDRAFT_143988 [Phycomyces blakesleeanus NRRL 1555(-)]